MKVGDLVVWTHTEDEGERVWWTEHLGVIIHVEGPSIKVRWESGKESWMNEAWLGKVA